MIIEHHTPANATDAYHSLDPWALPPGAAACLFAVLGGAGTVTAVAEATQLPRMTCYGHLCQLKHHYQVITWDKGKAGTIRPTVGVVVGSWL